MKRKALAGLFAIFVGLSALVGQTEASDKTMIVGSKEFTEQLILGQIMIAMLEARGFECRDRTGIEGTEAVRNALQSGNIDIYMEYTGTTLTNHLCHDTPITDPLKCYAAVKEEDLEKNGLVWLPMLDFNNTYCLTMRRADAEEKSIRTLSDLSEYISRNPKETIVGVNAEFYVRPDGFIPLQAGYDLRVPPENLRKMEEALLYVSLRDGAVDVSMGFATDPRILAYDLVVLEDDRHFFPAYNPAPVVRKATLERYPELEVVFTKLATKLGPKEILELNRQVDIEGRSPAEVAREWLEKNGLL